MTDESKSYEIWTVESHKGYADQNPLSKRFPTNTEDDARGGPSWLHHNGVLRWVWHSGYIPPIA